MLENFTVIESTRYLIHWGNFLIDFPKVVIQVGGKLKPDDIREFDDVYLTCEINPNIQVNVIHLRWYHNVSSDSQLFLKKFSIVVYNK